MRSGGRLVALPARAVIETMRPLPIEPLRGAPRFVRGTSVVRGVPTPIVDLGALLGGRDGASARRLISVRAGGRQQGGRQQGREQQGGEQQGSERQVGLLVDEVVGVRDGRAFAQRGLSPLLQGSSDDAVREMGVLDGELLTVLREGCLVPEQAWEAVRAGGTA